MKAAEIYEKVTNEIIAAIENGEAGTWMKPWVDMGGLPINATTRKAYSGGNVLVLLITGHLNEYPSQEWATYKQWEAIGAQVKKGEKSTSCVRWNPVACKEHKKAGVQNRCRDCRMLPFGFALFNAAQVDGYTPEPPAAGLSESERLTIAEEWFAAIGATVKHGGDGAYYAPVGDYINMPTFAQFESPVTYYAVMAHEHTHWTGHADRCARDLQGRFGDDKYAAEELVAELGAAFICATLGISVATHPNHIDYTAHWLKILRADSKAIFTAAGLASKAVEYMIATVKAKSDGLTEAA